MVGIERQDLLEGGFGLRVLLGAQRRAAGQVVGVGRVGLVRAQLVCEHHRFFVVLGLGRGVSRLGAHVQERIGQPHLHGRVRGLLERLTHQRQGLVVVAQLVVGQGEPVEHGGRGLDLAGLFQVLDGVGPLLFRRVRQSAQAVQRVLVLGLGGETFGGLQRGNRLRVLLLVVVGLGQRVVVLELVAVQLDGLQQVLLGIGGLFHLQERQAEHVVAEIVVGRRVDQLLEFGGGLVVLAGAELVHRTVEVGLDQR